MKQEYDESAVHTQLKYLESLYDVDKAVKKREKAALEGTGMSVKPEPLPKDHIEIFRLLNKHMSFAIENNAYNWIRPSLWSTLFRRPGDAALLPGVAVAAK
jgi:DNA polymerase alpha subunit A